MRKLYIRVSMMLMVGLPIVLSSAVGEAQTDNSTRIVLPEGTVIPAVLDKPLSSAKNRQGDRFTATVRSAQNGDAEFPRGTKFEGVIAGVQRAKKNQPGMLDLSFRAAKLPDGQRVSADGSVISLDEKNVTQTSSGRLMAKNRAKKDRMKFIAIGTGAGLILGQLTKHTLEGALLGAAGGYFYGESRRRKARPVDVTLRQGTEFGVKLHRAIAFNTSRAFVVARRNYRYGTPPPTSVPSRSPEVPSRSPEMIGVVMDGRNIIFGRAEPMMDGGIVLVPFKPVMDASGLGYNYNDQRRTLRVETDEGELFVKVGADYALLDGERENLEAPVQIHRGDAYVPLRFLALATGKRVMWDAKTHTVIITSPRTRAG